MNIIEMHKKIDGIVDQAGTPRFELWQKDNAINEAINKIVRGKAFIDEKVGSQEYFEKNAKIMQDLHTLAIVDDPTGLTITNGTIIGLPNMHFLYDVKITYDNIEYGVDPSKSISGDVYVNPFTRPKVDANFERLFYQRTSTGLKLKLPKSWDQAVTNPKISYLKYQNIVSHGTVKTVGSIIDPTSNPIPICLSLLGFARQKQPSGLGPEVEFQYAQQITTLVSPYVNYQITSGEFVTDYINCDLPLNLHDDICKEAADILVLSVESNLFERMQNKDQMDKQI